MAKRYYWLKLMEDFFDDKYIKALRKLPDGDALVIVYLKMQLKSLKTEGIIKYDKILPSAEEELALILDEDVNIVRLTISALSNMGLIEIWDDDSFYMAAMQNLIGSESDSAQRVRKHREIKAQIESKNSQKTLTDSDSLHCNSTVTLCNTDIDIDIDIDKDIDKDIEKKNKKQTVKTVVSEMVDDEDIKEVINDFIEMRKTMKKPMTVRAVKMLIGKLNRLSEDKEIQIKILEQSILHNWLDVYELKEDKKGGRYGGNSGTRDGSEYAEFD